MRIAYLRTDFWFGLVAGGSVGHVAGVINGFARLGHDVRVFATDLPRGIADQSVRVRVVRPWSPLRAPVVRRVGPLVYNAQLMRAASVDTPPGGLDLVYHRHGDLSCAGALLARKRRVPLVLEVNGLVLEWAREMGDRAIRLIAPLARGLEDFSLRAARLVVAVSDAVRDQLVRRGVSADRILVNPNGVDAGTFHPGVPGGPTRSRLGLGDAPVVGFIGTFGGWHGVDVLARCVPAVLAARPDTRFLFVGDGPLRGLLEAAVREGGYESRVAFTGLVPAEQAPAHLAACDVVVAPHGPPRFGPFVGSPTKVFEYMAMGKPIVASRLGQMATVLVDERTALLVSPGSSDELAAGILRLLGDPGLAARLGSAAREHAVSRFTWDHHVRRTLGALESR